MGEFDDAREVVMDLIREYEDAEKETYLTGPGNPESEDKDLRTDGMVSKTFYSVVSSSNFTSHAVPFPIITARGVNTFEGECIPRDNGTQYEFVCFSMRWFSLD